MKIVVLLSVLFIWSGVVFGQSENQTKKENKNPNSDRGATYNDTSKKTQKKKVKYNYDFDGKIKEFDKLMQANVKKYKKRDRLMQKPQYSDPTYFGHKKKPKKRPPNKRKLCKQCDIVH